MTNEIKQPALRITTQCCKCGTEIRQPGVFAFGGSVACEGCVRDYYKDRQDELDFELTSRRKEGTRWWKHNKKSLARKATNPSVRVTQEHRLEACPDCGLGYAHGYGPDERYHRRVHDVAINGPRTKVADGWHFITYQSRMSVQRLAQAAASLARYDTGYDFVSYCGVKKKLDEFKTIAVIRVLDGRVSGLLVSRERKCEYKVSLDTFREDRLESWRPTKGEHVEPHPRRAVDMIWVVKKRRRQGLGSGLLKALAEHCQVRPEDIAHMTPFREDALKLWRGYGLSTLYIV